MAILTRFENSDRNNHSSYLDYRDLRARADVFDGVLAHFFFPVGVRTSDRPQVALGQFVTANYFTVLGVEPAMGRAFRQAEDGGSESSSVAVISHRLWTRAFNANPAIIGTTIQVNSRPFTIVGVTPDGPHGPREVAKIGVVKLAAMTGAPILPGAYSASRGTRLKTLLNCFWSVLPVLRLLLLPATTIELPSATDDCQLATHFAESILNMVFHSRQGYSNPKRAC